MVEYQKQLNEDTIVAYLKKASYALFYLHVEYDPSIPEKFLKLSSQHKKNIHQLKMRWFSIDVLAESRKMHGVRFSCDSNLKVLPETEEKLSPFLILLLEFKNLFKAMLAAENMPTDEANS